jgi:hypothetical protein
MRLQRAHLTNSLGNLSHVKYPKGEHVQRNLKRCHFRPNKLTVSQCCFPIARVTSEDTWNLFALQLSTWLYIYLSTALPQSVSCGPPPSVYLKVQKLYKVKTVRWNTIYRFSAIGRQKGCHWKVIDVSSEYPRFLVKRKNKE